MINEVNSNEKKNRDNRIYKSNFILCLGGRSWWTRGT